MKKAHRSAKGNTQNAVKKQSRSLRENASVKSAQSEGQTLNQLLPVYTVVMLNSAELRELLVLSQRSELVAREAAGFISSVAEQLWSVCSMLGQDSDEFKLAREMEHKAIDLAQALVERVNGITTSIRDGLLSSALRAEKTEA
ncbi:MAG TPA: hypothetical protein VFB72_08435 [Verrucomicrobiae bacterium]|nr:hypothetical protein [Verrucomicrobiae bacterium]